MTKTMNITDEARQRGLAARLAGSLLSVEELLEKSHLDVSPTQEVQIRDRLLKMPKTCVRTYLTAMRGKSAKSGIRAFCQFCLGWEDYRVGVRNCTDAACPLFSFRPYQKST
jgi:hypothetical protein